MKKLKNNKGVAFCVCYINHFVKLILNVASIHEVFAGNQKKAQGQKNKEKCFFHNILSPNYTIYVIIACNLHSISTL